MASISTLTARTDILNGELGSWELKFTGLIFLFLHFFISSSIRSNYKSYTKVWSNQKNSIKGKGIMEKSRAVPSGGADDISTPKINLTGIFIANPVVSCRTEGEDGALLLKYDYPRYAYHIRLQSLLDCRHLSNHSRRSTCLSRGCRAF